LAALSFTARLMLDTIQIASASRRYAFTMPSRALLSSFTPGASTSTAPDLSTPHLRLQRRTRRTSGQKLDAACSFDESQ
jgi:hypothetical protein